MRIFRCKTNWILAGLFLMIITNGCSTVSGGCGGRKLSPTMEAQYQADDKAYWGKSRSLLEKKKQTRQLWQALIKNNAPRQEIDLAYLGYLSAAEDYDNYCGQEPPSRWDVKYTEHHHPETGHKHAHRPVKTIPPVTSHPPKPHKPPCTDHH